MTAPEIVPEQSHSRPTIRRSLAEGTYFLERAGIEEAHCDAEVLLSHALGIERAELYVKLAESVTETADTQYRHLLERRSAREPVAYITGHKEFWSMDFIVTPDVLIPRPETELLVEIATARLKHQPLDGPLRILDLCTGSGAVAISIAAEIRDAEVWATDVRAQALDVARRNRDRHGFHDRIHMVRGDLFDAFKPTELRFAAILCNPPYIGTGELAELLPEVSVWEPRIALDGGPDGLSFYRRLAAETSRWLEPGGQLLVEIGADMGKSVPELFRAAAAYDDPRLYQDYAGRDRIFGVARHRLQGE